MFKLNLAPFFIVGPMQSEEGEPSEVGFNVDPPPTVTTPPEEPQTPGNQPSPPPPTTTSSNNSNSLPDPNVAMRAAERLPPIPYTPDPNPGGFVPYDPTQQPPQTTPFYGDSSGSVAQLTPDQIAKAQKYCKWASSALNYDDVKTAINNLRNALELLQTGRDPA